MVPKQPITLQEWTLKAKQALRDAHQQVMRQRTTGTSPALDNLARILIKAIN